MSFMHAAASIELAFYPTLMACAEKTLDYCSCLANYTYVSNGTTYHSDGGCIQDDPDIPPWCIVYQKSCSQPPPKKPDGQFWDICRGAACTACILHVSQARWSHCSIHLWRASKLQHSRPCTFGTLSQAQCSHQGL